MKEQQSAGIVETFTKGRLGNALTSILFSLTAISALLYFLGRARIQSMQVELGIPAGILRSSTSEYLSAGADVIVQFFVLAATPVLAALIVHRTVVKPALAKPTYNRTHRVVRHTLSAITVLGVVGIGLVVYGLVDQDKVGRPLGLVLPVVLAGSAGFLTYRLHVLPRSARPTPSTSETTWRGWPMSWSSARLHSSSEAEA